MKYICRGDTKIKNKEIQKYTKIYEKLKRGISQEYSSSYKQATAQAKKIIIIKTKTKTLLILMKLSYATYHNHKI